MRVPLRYIRQCGLAMLLVVLGASCRNVAEQQPPHTILAQFTRSTTSADEAAVSAMGGTDVWTIRVINGLAFRGMHPAFGFSTLSDLSQVDDLGLEEDPEVSVFISVAGPATEEDLEFVRSFSVFANTGTFDNIIAAYMRLSAVDNLGKRERFVNVLVLPNSATKSIVRD